ncbi:hypothetical protein [Vibrio lentus]|uniref:hypothetical protein n=1 Tax=Vibrio lentus TaxID=136468 RepID=UPI000C86442F|nr:hypothetical protein [Vibrio lentus]PMM32589.1 hypothetical protein BCT58_26860 [Vibrio lentus]
MTFKAIVHCDAAGCANEMQLDCDDASDAELRHDEINEDTSWFADFETGEHYCPSHAQAAMEEIAQ